MKTINNYINMKHINTYISNKIRKNAEYNRET